MEGTDAEADAQQKLADGTDDSDQRRRIAEEGTAAARTKEQVVFFFERKEQVVKALVGSAGNKRHELWPVGVELFDLDLGL